MKILVDMNLSPEWLTVLEQAGWPDSFQYGLFLSHNQPDTPPMTFDLSPELNGWLPIAGPLGSAFMARGFCSLTSANPILTHA